MTVSGYEFDDSGMINQEAILGGYVELGSAQPEEFPSNTDITTGTAETDSLAPVFSLDVVREQINEAYSANQEQGIEDSMISGDSIAMSGEAAFLLHGDTAADDQQVDAIVLDGNFGSESVSEKPLKFRARSATVDDIDRLVAVDMEVFADVYSSYELSGEDLRADLKEKFMGRYEKVGGDWIQVLEGDGKIYGFMMGCPTNKTAEGFESWEETTDNGTLEATYDPDGKNIYIVSLSMTPEASKTAGQTMLYANFLGKAIQEGRDGAFFESRLPGLRGWVESQYPSDFDVDTLTDAEKFEIANAYAHKKEVVNGKEVPCDPLMRTFNRAGCTFVNGAIPDAYKDRPSMDFGVVATYENPLPKSLRENKLIRKIVGGGVRALSRSQRLTNWMF